jgi:hypothetical protein
MKESEKPARWSFKRRLQCSQIRRVDNLQWYLDPEGHFARKGHQVLQTCVVEIHPYVSSSAPVGSYHPTTIQATHNATISALLESPQFWQRNVSRRLE